MGGICDACDCDGDVPIYEPSENFKRAHAKLGESLRGGYIPHLNPPSNEIEGRVPTESELRKQLEEKQPAKGDNILDASNASGCIITPRKGGV